MRILERGKRVHARLPVQIFFTNTLSGKKEVFMSRTPGLVLMYTCGPTVYSQQHIGNLRPSILSDTIARTLSYAGYRVRRVINITDVGHLVGDEDQGEDKMTVGAVREKATPEEIATRYARLFIDDLAEIGLDTEYIRFPRATEYVKEQIALAKTLEEKGFTYFLPSGLYFETTKFPRYGQLGGLSGAKLRPGTRVEVVSGKHDPADFVLWRTAKPHDLQQWDSPWGRGNPGWHLECSAMIRTLLSSEIDIHTGGEDLAVIHHNAEIAESEAATGRPFVRYWLHNAFLTMEGEKISKSLGNVVYLSGIAAKGFHPLALRYFFLQAHYRTPLSFSWDACAGAMSGLDRLWRLSSDIAEESKRISAPSESRTHFLALMRDDLATPQALGLLWEALRSEEYAPEEKWGLLEDAEAHLGLSLLTPPRSRALQEADIPKEIRSLLTERETARLAKDFVRADQIRARIEKGGYRVDDGPSGPILTRRTL